MNDRSTTANIIVFGILRTFAHRPNAAEHYPNWTFIQVAAF
ncbi:hypothetical protein [Lentibacter algarum]|nr:hypothetical protein [Lentibacter algarum]